MYSLGLDIGSSSVKVSVLDIDTGNCVCTANHPEKEMKIIAHQAGWAEQHPEVWWENTRVAIGKAFTLGKFSGKHIASIGITYQMHGLVCVDINRKVLRPAIIWCDSRAVENGNYLFDRAGKELCKLHLLNSPGNFTLSKLHWVKLNEPEVYKRIHKFILPGDYIAMRMTGEVSTTTTGLSEGILWDFKENNIADFLLKAAGIMPDLVPEIVPIFGVHGYLATKAAQELHLPVGIPLTYRAGDQPNNAFSLNVLHPGETAATAGTSGVVYGITDQYKSDPHSRVNNFAHVNHSKERPRIGVLLCINGSGIANSWIRNITGASDFDLMNKNIEKIAPGSDGLIFLPFGNGSERMLQNVDQGGVFKNINFNLHTQKHMQRSVQEGIAFAFNYGIKIMQESGISTHVIRAGFANMFLSPLFCRILATLTNSRIELFNTDGSLGAARGAALGAGFYKSAEESLSNLKRIQIYESDDAIHDQLHAAYNKWEKALLNQYFQNEN